ncbi:hypothetical protein [Halopiger djelfimassiliensis]|uniref:hypothetical protein n=1 Tax=Halopiger djelfimassiliensis TaxID=1293047 RepID=UPI0012B56DD8|nr:hypothetical protein [Halopiger djelfimassiliensis]
MTEEYLAKTLKRIYDECQRAQDDDDEKNVGKTLISKFNGLLNQYKEEYPEHTVIQSIEPVDTSGPHGSAHPQDVQEIKLNVLEIADSLGLDTDDFQEPVSSDSLTTINIQQQQSVSQSVTVKNLLKQVDNRMMSESDKEELKEVIQEYQDEIESKDPDETKLQELLNKARDKSPDIALKLGMAGLERGIDLLI